MPLVPYSQWWEANYSPSRNTNRTWEGTGWQDTTFNTLRALGALQTNSGHWYDAHSILVDTEKLKGKQMATNTTPTLTGQNKTLADTIKDTLGDYIDPLKAAFNQIEGSLQNIKEGTTRTINQTAQPSGNVAAPAISPMMIAAAAALVLLFIFRKKF